MKVKLVKLVILNILYIVVLWALTMLLFGEHILSYNVSFFIAVFANAFLGRLFADITMTAIETYKEHRGDVVEVRVTGDNNKVKINTTRWIEEWQYYGGGEGKYTGRLKQQKLVDGNWIDTGSYNTTKEK